MSPRRALRLGCGGCLLSSHLEFKVRTCYWQVLRSRSLLARRSHPHADSLWSGGRQHRSRLPPVHRSGAGPNKEFQCEKCPA